MINIDRIENHLNTTGKIGQTEYGLNRIAFSEEYYSSIEKLERYAKEYGFATYIDKVGNLFISYNPKNKEKNILIGSHMDSVKSGGIFDGALGVFAGVEILESIKENNVELINYGITVVAFNAEEGSEMGGTFGSRTICDRNDLNDSELAKKAAVYNLTIDDLKASVYDLSKVSAFLELHIEQGAFLENSNLDIGVVDGIVGITRYDLSILGTSNHAGTTPMNLRDDPVRKIPVIIDTMFEYASKYENPFVMTVGDIKVKPGMYNVIPNEVKLLIEVRDMDQGNIDDFFESIDSYLKSMDFNYKLERNIEKPSVKLNVEVIATIASCSEELGYKTVIMSSGAGHDAKEMNYKVPTGMIFIPSIEGISHSPDEFSTLEQIEKGINVLYNTVIKIDEVGI